MIMKSVEMHVKMLAGHIGVSVLLLVVGIVISPMFLVGVAALLGHGLYKVYGRMLFDDDAAVIMTLPFSARDMVLSKVLAVLLWCGGMWLAILVAILLNLGEGADMQARMKMWIESWQLAGMDPWQVGVSAGGSVIAPVAYVGVFCMLLLALELKCSGQAEKRRSRIAILLVVLLAAAVFAVVFAGLFCLMEMAKQMASGYFWMAAAGNLLILLSGWLCCRLSVRLLETRYDLV